ncbi:MAG: hypothetical protein JNJ46_16295 [Myxococcales bacterium]|nr:hypothetical protein [Myxococcales bacterium]
MSASQSSADPSLLSTHVPAESPTVSARHRTSLQAGPSVLAVAYASCALSITTSLVFFLTGVSPLPVLLYFPLSRRFGFSGPLGELSMDYYGRSLVALLAGAAAALVVYLLCGASSRVPAGTVSSTDAGTAENRDEMSDRLALLATYVVTAAVLAAGLFAYQLGTRVPTPELPPTAAPSPRI